MLLAEWQFGRFVVHQIAIWSILEKDKYLQFLCVSPNYHLIHLRKYAEWQFGGTHKNCKYLSFSKIDQIAIGLITLKCKRNLRYLRHT